jgi:hypothetical protein
VRSRKSRLALAAMTAGALALPASAQAITVSVTGDDGVPQGPAGQTIRNMSPQVAFGLQPAVGSIPAEQSYAFSVVGPTGQVAASSPCSFATSSPRTVTYQGNGVYTINVTSYAGTCATPVRSGAVTFAIGAGVAIASDPNTPLLTRQPGEYSTIEHRLPVTGNPGADTYDVAYSGNSALAPDGGLVGPSQSAYVDAATATVPIRFSDPGTYTVVARARVYGGGATPWTAPLKLRVYAPFDFSSSSFPDSRGPSYRLRVRLREEDTRGRVRIYVAKRWSKYKYHRIGTVRIRKGVFTKRFTLHNPGTYRIRYRFQGSSTTAPGTVVEKVRIRRTVRFTSVGDAADHELTFSR